MSSLIEQYGSIIRNNPLLTKQEEVELAIKIKKGDQKARKKLIESNYRLVFSIAKKYKREGLCFEDLLQESSTGLIKAVDRFDHTLGYKFSTYASWWIKQSTIQYINDNMNPFKVPTNSKLLLIKIKEKSKEFKAEFGYTPSPRELSKILGENVEAIKNAINASGSSISFDSETDETKSLKDKIEDQSIGNNQQKVVENKELHDIIRKNLKLLTAKEEKIIRLRFGITEKQNDTVNFPITKEEIKELLNDEE